MPLQTLQSVSSTMDAARENALAGRVRFDEAGRAVPSGLRAEEQTAGRGQRGREWFAMRGECLCATYYIRLNTQTPERAGQLAFVAGVAIAETLQEWKAEAEKIEDRRQKTEAEDTLLTVNSQLPTPNSSFILPPSSLQIANPFQICLKWPNDIMLNGRKVGGILIELVRCAIAAQAETCSQDDWPQDTPSGLLYTGSALNSSGNEPAHSTGEEWVALVGVGINVQIREFPPELEGSATSLWREGVEDCDIGALAEKFGLMLEQTAALWRVEGFEAILARWRQYDTTPGRVYTTTVEGETAQGTAEGIEVDGQLRLRLTDGRVLPVLSASSLQEIPRSL